MINELVELFELLAPTIIYLYIDSNSKRFLNKNIKDSSSKLFDVIIQDQDQKELLKTNLKSKLILPFTKFTYEAAVPVIFINFLLLWVRLDASILALGTLIAGFVYVWVSLSVLRKIDLRNIPNEQIAKAFAWLANRNIYLQALCMFLIKIEVDFFDKSTIMLIYITSLTILTIRVIFYIIKYQPPWVKRKASFLDEYK